MVAERVLMGLLLGGIAIGCGFVLYPFLSAIVWAGILVFATWPIFDQVRKLGLSRGPAALVMLGLVAVVVVLPVTLAAPGGADDANYLLAIIEESLRRGLPLAPGWLEGVPLVGNTLTNLWNGWAADLSAMAAFFRPWFGLIAESALNLLLGVAHGVLSFLLALFIAFFFYMYGKPLGDRLQAVIRRIAGERAERLIEVTGLTVRGTVYGILGTAVVQGMLTLFGLWLTGVPRPGLLALVAGFLSVLPIGAPLVWIPASLWLLSVGKTGWGIFLLVYGGGLISGSDSVIRPYFIARGADLPFLLTILGVLGGALAFGLLGIFLGPVLLGVAFTLVNEFAEIENVAELETLDEHQ
jgi:predicted PurR-regulated permease PerM